MTESQHERERKWNVRKQSQNPHGKVKSFDELAGGAGKNGNKTK